MHKLLQRHRIVLLTLLFVGACTGLRPQLPPVDISDTHGIDPRQNFYQAVNADWLQSTHIPHDRPAINNFVTLSNQVNDRIKALIIGLGEQNPRTAQQEKVARIYHSYMDTSSRNARGIAPIEQQLRSIAAIRNHREVAIAFARQQRLGMAGPLVGMVDTDYQDSNRHIVYISQAGLGLEREYYTGTDTRSSQQRALYQAMLAKLCALGQFAAPESVAENVVALENQLAHLQRSRVDNRDVAKTYNIVPYPQLLTSANQLMLDVQLQELGIATGYPISVMQPEYLQQLNQLFPTVDVATWKQYLSTRVLLNYAELLGDDFREVLSQYNIARGSYAKEPPRWQLAIAYIDERVGMLLGELYIEAYFDDSIKAQVNAIKDNIHAEYRHAITHSRRLSAQTRQSALHKLDKMAFQIGYPDKWQDYSSLSIARDDLLGNDMRIAQYEHLRNVRKLGMPVDRQEWYISPHNINAFYNPGTNTFVLLAGILQEPFFSAQGDQAVNYGGIGFVIGHEIGHGFDDQGSRFDADGNLANWWTSEDAAKFAKLSEQLIVQANEYEILPGHYLNGELEIGEIIGDLSGAEIALRAFNRLADDMDNPPAAKRRFLDQLAITWRNKMRDEYLLNLLQSDPHPPSEYRANGTVRNLDEFHYIYQTKAGDDMYLAPKERVRLW